MCETVETIAKQMGQTFDNCGYNCCHLDSNIEGCIKNLNTTIDVELDHTLHLTAKSTEPFNHVLPSVTNGTGFSHFISIHLLNPFG